MKVEYDNEGVPVLEDAIISLLDEAYELTGQDEKRATIMNDAAAHMIWFLGQNGHNFHAPRLEALYKEMFIQGMEDADAGFGFTPTLCTCTSGVMPCEYCKRQNVEAYFDEQAERASGAAGLGL